jgi:hypothetical protein
LAVEEGADFGRDGLVEGEVHPGIFAQGAASSQLRRPGLKTRG